MQQLNAEELAFSKAVIVNNTVSIQEDSYEVVVASRREEVRAQKELKSFADNRDVNLERPKR